MELILWVVVGFLLLVFFVSFYIIRNLLNKVETIEDLLIRAEEVVLGYNIYLDQISKVIKLSSEKMESLDHKGSFESDDEVGFFFKQIKGIQEILNDFRVVEYKQAETKDIK